MICETRLVELSAGILSPQIVSIFSSSRNLSPGHTTRDAFVKLPLAISPYVSLGYHDRQ